MSASARRSLPQLDPHRLLALVRKETLQIARDPSAILIAFVLPVVLLFLFAFAVSLDVRDVKIGVVLESDAPEAQSLAAAFAGTRYFLVTPARNRREIEPEVIAGRLHGMVVIPQDFDIRLERPERGPLVQIVTDGTEPNTASFVGGYAQGVVANWLASRSGGSQPKKAGPTLEPRFWFNPEIESKRFLIPGAIAIVMTMIGTLLTAMVVAREWERGTMEAMMSTPASILEILVGKLLPYFGLGLIATLGCSAAAVFLFDVPLRGSVFALLLLSCSFLIPALGQGLLISAIAKNQFIAAQVALVSGFLPALLLSGFIFEIDSMPLVIRVFTRLVAARYFVASLQSVFLAGDVWSLFVPSILSMLAIGAVFFTITALKSRKSLDA
ncbi:MAG TPA: ABC transporter permease [Gammaproteobacteria bacterium]|nr:ABC transporter permease [Gammaproteobacteria bacterium]